MKMEKWVKRYFDDEIPILESLYIQKNNKYDTATYAYSNNSNKSIKFSSNFFNKKNKMIEKEKFDLLFNFFKINYNTSFCSLCHIKGYFVYYFATIERKIIIILPSNLNLAYAKSMIEEIKKEMFDYIFIL